MIRPLVKFGEIFERVDRSFELKDDEEYDCVGVRWYRHGAFLRERLSGMQIKRKQQWRIHTGDIVYNKLFAWKGSFAVADESVDGCIVSDKFPTYRPDQDKVQISYLKWFFKTEQVASQAQRLSKGAAAISKLTLNPPQFWELEIPLPPLEEQRRIVAKVERLAPKIDAVRGLRRQSEREAVALLRSGPESAFQRLQSTVGCQALADVSKTITDGDHITPTFTDQGILFIFVGNVSTGRLHFDSSKRVSNEYFCSLRPQRVPRRGDILYSAVGATLGIPALVDTDESFCFQRHVAIVKPDRSKVDSRFVWHMLRSSTVFEQAWASTTGSAQPTIPLRAIRKLPVPVPSLPDQRRLVAYLDGLQAKADRLRALQAQTRAELDALLPSILDRAFKGEL